MKKGEHNMRWVNTELPKGTANRFKEYLRDNHIQYEASEADNLIHFECYMSETQISNANAFIDERC